MSPEDKQRKEGSRSRMADVLRQQQTVGGTSQHWVVEEAERRRKAEQSGKERLQKLQSRQQQGYPAYSPPASTAQQRTSPPRDYSLSPQGGGAERVYSSHQPSPPRSNVTTNPTNPTHVMEHEERPYNSSPPQPRPIPDSIKQTLIDRVTSPRSPGGSQPAPSSSHYAYPHQVVNPTYTPSSSPYTALPYSDPSPPDPPYSKPPAKPPRTLVDPLSPQQQALGYNATYSTSQTNLYQQSSSHHSTFQQPPPSSSSPQVITYPYSGGSSNATSPYQQQQQQQPLVTASPYDGAPYHARSGSDGSDRAPPVPPKPPRLLSTSSEESRAEQVTVSGYQQCAHCEEELGEEIGVCCIGCCSYRVHTGYGNMEKYVGNHCSWKSRGIFLEQKRHGIL